MCLAQYAATTRTSRGGVIRPTSAFKFSPDFIATDFENDCQSARVCVCE